MRFAHCFSRRPSSSHPVFTGGLRLVLGSSLRQLPEEQSSKQHMRSP